MTDGKSTYISKLKLPPHCSSERRLWLGIKTNSSKGPRATSLSSMCCWFSQLLQLDHSLARVWHYEDQRAKCLHTFQTYLTVLPPDLGQLQNTILKSRSPLAIYLTHFFCHFLPQNKANHVFYINFSFACLRPEYRK